MRTAVLVLIGSLITAGGVAQQAVPERAPEGIPQSVPHGVPPGTPGGIPEGVPPLAGPATAASCPSVDPMAAPLPSPADPNLMRRLLKYSQLQVRHRVTGLASYYSSFFHGRKTANGEIFQNNRFSAAHLTLPLGCWVEVRARATGKTLRLRVNDRGPYVKKFAIDLSQAAARYLGVDKAKDRHVEFRVIALPGEEPLPENIDWSLLEKATATASASAATPGS